MKLADHTDKIRRIIDQAFRNRLGRMGISEKVNQPLENIPAEYRRDRQRIETIFETLIEETNHKRSEAYEKLVEEFTFTLFNRLAALKVMEAHTLHPEIVTRRAQHGGRSFAHLAWLEEHPDQRNTEQEGLIKFLEDEFNKLSTDINLFSPDYPYHLLPTAIELNQIAEAFNHVETDAQVETDIWRSDDVMGWLYESYNNYKKIAHKESKAKTEYNKVSIQSQVYTPRWVVKFLVDNSLGKLYLEMFPHSEIKDKYQIANAPAERTRTPKPLTEIKLIDPACGSANFLLYAFDLFYDFYLDQIENYAADYAELDIPDLIIRHNLHGIDLEDRAVQIAQLGLYIKVRRHRRRKDVKIEHFNVVSSDFFLPDFAEVRELFETDAPLDENLEKIVSELWTDLQQAYKFGALIQLEEKFNSQWQETVGDISLPIFEIGYAQKISELYLFHSKFFDRLKNAVAQHNRKFGASFLSVKTADALTFLELLTQKYDVAVANPPYTDSSDFGGELKTFVEANYKKPYKFNSNLYAVFIKRCAELTDDQYGKIGMLHPLTFMYISSFTDVRKYILKETHINILAELGLGGVFASSDVQADVAAYIFEKDKSDEHSVFLDFKKYKNHTNKPEVFASTYKNLINDSDDDHVYKIDQSKLEVIEGAPFVYWISDGFRDKFKADATKDLLDNCQGMATTNNNRFVRFWWEVAENTISKNYSADRRKWVPYIKGGPYNKWFGNLWSVVNYYNNGEELIELVKVKYPKISDPEFVIKNRKFYFQKGINYSASGSKGASFRFHPENYIFDVGGASIFPTSNFDNIPYILAFFNSNLCAYIINCLNPTVNTQSGDIERVPFVLPNKRNENSVSTLALANIKIKQKINSYQIIENNFEKNSLSAFPQSSLQERLSAYLNYENSQLVLVLLNEAIINRLIFEVYDLSDEDRAQVEVKMGMPVGELPVLPEAREAFLQLRITNYELRNGEDDLSFVNEFIRELPSVEFESERIQTVKAEFATLYQGNNDLEEFCIHHQLNPINVWYWFEQSGAIPVARARDTALEFLADVCRAVLTEDADGIVPLVNLPGEPALLDRLESKCLSLGFTPAQFAQLDGLLGRPVKDYLEHHFFANLSDHLKLFKQLPSTPFIWHLSSGAEQGFEAYIIIYQWTRDSLYKLKSTYLARREEALNYRLSQIAQAETAQAQTEKEKIRLQLQEINDFTRRVDELIAENYNPTLDDGVGKNIAPLQKKKMLRADVLNAKQLEKYLNADW